MFKSLKEEDRKKLLSLLAELRAQVGSRIRGGCKSYGWLPNGKCPSVRGWVRIRGKKYPGCYNANGGCNFLKSLPLKVLAIRIAEEVVK